MTDRAVLWIWLQDCISFSNNNVKAIFDFFEKPEDIITADEKFLRDTGLGFVERRLWTVWAGLLLFFRDSHHSM